MPEILLDERLALIDLARDLAREGKTREEVYRALNGAGHGLERGDAEEIAALSGARPTPRPAVDPDAANYTDVGNGRRMVARHGENIRFVPASGRWLLWNDRLWATDETEGVMRLAKETASSIQDEARAQKKAKLFQWGLTSESVGKLEAMLKAARSEPGIAIRTDQLDADPWLMTVANGTLDLRAGRLRFHRREDLISKGSPVAFDPEARCPLWEAFLERVMDGNRELIQFLRRSIGYALTGSTREQVVFLLYGTGANGKSVFLETVGALVGDYGKTADFSTFLAKGNQGAANTDIARLFGARFVSAIEADEGKRLAEALVKQLTGGDVITARFLYQDFFEFTPAFKVFLAANHKPVIRGADHAIWRRVRLIPFTVTIPADERDQHLGEKLKGELPGILNWALRGCLDWQESGLGMPAEVLAAIEEYRAEMDPLEDFLDEECTLEKYAAVGATELWNAWAAWCHRNGEEPRTQTWFGRRLADRGIETDKLGLGRTKRRIGIRLRPRDGTVRDSLGQSSETVKSDSENDMDSSGQLSANLTHARAHENTHVSTIPTVPTVPNSPEDGSEGGGNAP